MIAKVIYKDNKYLLVRSMIRMTRASEQPACRIRLLLSMFSGSRIFWPYRWIWAWPDGYTDLMIFVRSDQRYRCMKHEDGAEGW